MTVIYDGIRFTADEIVKAAHAQNPHVIGLSILSGSHVPLANDVVEKLAEAVQQIAFRDDDVGGKPHVELPLNLLELLSDLAGLSGLHHRGGRR